MAAAAGALTFGLDELFERTSEIGVAEYFARLGRTALGLIHLHCRWILPDLARSRDAASQAVADWKTILGHIDGLRQNLAKTHRTPAVQQDIPCVDNAGHGSRQKAVALRELASKVLVVP